MNETGPRVTLLVLTLNEIEGLRAIMPRVSNDWVDQIIVVDGGSTDGTIEWAKANGYQVYVQKKKGFRHAYTEVWPLVVGDVVITFSPDGNSIPELIPSLLQELSGGYDMVIVSRYLHDAESLDDDLLTSLGNWFFTKSINLFFGASYTDAMVIFRAYMARLPENLGLMHDQPFRLPEKVFRTKISWEPLMSVRAARYKYRISEIPGSEPARIGGERKLKVFRWGGAYYLQILIEFMRRISEKSEIQQKKMRL